MKKMYKFYMENPNVCIAILLFAVGIFFLFTSVPMVAGALFAAGATLLGAWVTELNNRRSSSEEKKTREVYARKALAPELNRTIERILYIHRRAIANFSSASSALEVKNKASDKESFTSKDSQEDFIPYMPTLYPNAPQLHDLPYDHMITLAIFYDSLHSLEKLVNDWWDREGELQANFFNMIRHTSSKSLSAAEDCIKKFELEKLCPPEYESQNSLSSRISESKKSAAEILKKIYQET